MAERFREPIKAYFRKEQEEFVPGKTIIPLSAPTYGWEEVVEALDSLLSTYVTMGKKVQEFEKIFSSYIGTKYATMVNSGSSANLIAMSVLANPALGKRAVLGTEVITPAVTWSTTVYPIINSGCVPVLVDVDLETYGIDVTQVERAISEKVTTILPVHLLGNPCDIVSLRKIADEHGLFLVEDCCEAPGAQVGDRKVGSFSDISSFSFFFSHHISTIEGGMVLTNTEEFHLLIRTLRAHGWIRDREDKEDLASKYLDIDPRFLFVNLGYNFRPTEIQGAFGIHQMAKLEDFIRIRRENALYWTRELKKHSDYIIVPEERKGIRHVWFGYPIIVRPEAPFTRKEMVAWLEARKIETRPIMAGNIAAQPVSKLVKLRVAGELKNSELIMRSGFFFGNHHRIRKKEREFIVSAISEFIENRAS